MKVNNACGGSMADPLKSTMQSALMSGYSVTCTENLRWKGTITVGGMERMIDQEVDAHTSNGGNSTDLGSHALSSDVSLPAIFLHELVHGVGSRAGEDENFGCEKACYGEGTGSAANCK
jgi:hypothetical protein